MKGRTAGNRPRLVAFAGLTALAAWRYARVQTHPPTARVIGLAALATGVGVVMAGAVPMAVRGRRRRGTVPRLAGLTIAFVAALLIAGIPVRLLAPGRWGTLARRLHGGLDSIPSTLWPYSGTDTWTRIDLLLVLAVVPLAAGALAFWPARLGAWHALARARARRGAALALLLTVYVLGLLDSDGGSVTVEGVLLLALIAAWLWPAPAVGGAGRRRGAGRRTGAAVAWLAVSGAFAAALTTTLAGGEALLGYRGWNLFGSGDSRISFGWDQTYGPITWSRSQRTMFTVSAPRSELWKTTTLDRFDGTRFVRSPGAPGEQDLPLPLNDSWYRFARFTIADLRSSLLPAEQGVTSGVNIGERVSYDEDGTVSTQRSALQPGATYTVLSYVPDPPAADLRAAPRTLPAGYRRYTEFQLPGPSSPGVRPSGPGVRTPGPVVTARDRRLILASPYGSMYRLAHRIAHGRRTAYDVARAIEQYLQFNEAYDERVPVRRYPLASFLSTDHLGYCQQFSGAMALMLRMDGIPARIAAGFLPGTYDTATRQWVVRAVDAHSWVEVYFSGIGWVPFNPTPSRIDALPQRPLFSSPRAAAETQMQAIAATVGGLPPRPVSAPAAPRRRPGRSLGWGIAVAAASVTLLGLLALAAGWLAGRVRLRRSLRGDGELATRELVHGLRRLGYALPATVTLSRIEAIVRLHGGPDAARYVSRLRDRRYGPEQRESATLADRRRLRRGLTQRLGLDARLRGLWALPPGAVAWRLGRDHRGGP